MRLGSRVLAALLFATPLVGLPVRARADGVLSVARPSASERVLAVLTRIATNLRQTTYRHELHVDERAGRYEFDCSIMAAWVLSQAAPRALASVGAPHPLARDFYRAIAHAPVDRASAPLQRVARVADARPGDLLAWVRPPWFPSHNTGHVALIVGAPEPFENGYLLRIADASSYNHQDDSRAGGTGFGVGVILITTDPETGAGTGYGWFGRYSGEWIIPTPVAIGRVVR